MPELPEVETVRRDLQEHLVGRSVEAVTLRRAEVVRGMAATDGPGDQDICRAVEAGLTGLTVLKAERLGKNLIVGLSDGVTLLVNLGMTGQLFVCDACAELDVHAHLIAELSDGMQLVFRDTRRFGHIELARSESIGESFTLRNVGVDAMSAQFTSRRLAEMLAGRTAPAKSALLDQRRVAGLGNIYVCEALFRAGIGPEVRCDELAHEEVTRLHRAIREVLRESIAAEGTTISDYVTGRRVPGSFQKRLRVYGREGEPCLKRGCRGVIQRIVQSNRSTFCCPQCQRRPETNRGEPS